MNAKASSSSVSLSDDHLTLKTESVSTMYGVYICNYIIYIQYITIPFYILVMCCDSSILISFCFTNAKHPGAKAP